MGSRKSPCDLFACSIRSPNTAKRSPGNAHRLMRARAFRHVVTQPLFNRLSGWREAIRNRGGGLPSSISCPHVRINSLILSHHNIILLEVMRPLSEFTSRWRQCGSAAHARQQLLQRFQPQIKYVAKMTSRRPAAFLATRHVRKTRRRGGLRMRVSVGGRRRRPPVATLRNTGC
jgi:hypothetical protein